MQEIGQEEVALSQGKFKLDIRQNFFENFGMKGEGLKHWRLPREVAEPLEVCTKHVKRAFRVMDQRWI